LEAPQKGRERYKRLSLFYFMQFVVKESEEQEKGSNDLSGGEGIFLMDQMNFAWKGEKLQ